MFCYVAISQKVAKWSFKTTSKTTLFEDLNTFLHTLFRVEKIMKKKRGESEKYKLWSSPPLGQASSLLFRARGNLDLALA